MIHFEVSGRKMGHKAPSFKRYLCGIEDSALRPRCRAACCGRGLTPCLLRGLLLLCWCSATAPRCRRSGRATLRGLSAAPCSRAGSGCSSGRGRLPLGRLAPCGCGRLLALRLLLLGGCCAAPCCRLLALRLLLRGLRVLLRLGHLLTGLAGFIAVHVVDALDFGVALRCGFRIALQTDIHDERRIMQIVGLRDAESAGDVADRRELTVRDFGSLCVLVVQVQPVRTGRTFVRTVDNSQIQNGHTGITGLRRFDGRTFDDDRMPAERQLACALRRIVLGSVEGLEKLRHDGNCLCKRI